MGWARLSATLPVSRARTRPFQENRHFIFRALVTLKPLLSLTIRFVARSAEISVDTHTHTNLSTVTPAVHARRGLMIAFYSLKEAEKANCITSAGLLQLDSARYINK